MLAASAMTRATNQEDHELEISFYYHVTDETPSPSLSLTFPPPQRLGCRPRTLLPCQWSPSCRLGEALQSNIPLAFPSRHWSDQHPQNFRWSRCLHSLLRSPRLQDAVKGEVRTWGWRLRGLRTDLVQELCDVVDFIMNNHPDGLGLALTDVVLLHLGQLEDLPFSWHVLKMLVTFTT